MDNSIKFGEKLRELIKASRYKTYEKAANDFGISLGYLNQLMRNERHPSLELMAHIASKLQIEIGELFETSGKIAMSRETMDNLEKMVTGLLEGSDDPKLKNDPSYVNVADMSPTEVFHLFLNKVMPEAKKKEREEALKAQAAAKKQISDREKLQKLINEMSDEEINKYYSHFESIVDKSRDKNAAKKPKTS